MFFTFGLCGPCVSGMLAYAIRNMDGIQGKEGSVTFPPSILLLNIALTTYENSWRWIFILEGLLTVAISFLVFILVPDFPEHTKILTPMEKEHLLETLRRDKGDQKLDLKGINWFKVICDYRILFP
jgi:sugar phosphate permease